MIAGIGCRRGCTADDIIRVVRQAAALHGRVDALAAPAFKRHEPGLHEAAARLGLPLILVDDAALAAAQPFCPTRSARAVAATGFASVAEAAAIGTGGALVMARLAAPGATCALARHPNVP